MSQPAYAGIAGLSAREFKPTGLQAGWLFSQTTVRIIVAEGVNL
jgi:hypothetical protein